MRFVRFEFSQEKFYGELKNNKIIQWSDAPWLGGEKLTTEFNLNEVRLLAPCQPNKIIATAINYPGATGLSEKNLEPLVFIKPSTSVIGPNDTIISPFSDISAWGECELAIVIGKRLFKADTSAANEAVFGYTIGNDVSCENILDWDHHLARSKAADTFCPLGPWIDNDFDPNGKLITGYHNDELMRKGVCHERLWKEPELLVWLSSWMTLEPGDVILTGAPSRVRDRIYFKNGDKFKCEIAGLGELINTFSCDND